jgi:hypothetical protein
MSNDDAMNPNFSTTTVFSDYITKPLSIIYQAAIDTLTIDALIFAALKGPAAVPGMLAYTMGSYTLRKTVNWFVKDCLDEVSDVYIHKDSMPNIKLITNVAGGVVAGFFIKGNLFHALNLGLYEFFGSDLDRSIGEAVKTYNPIEPMICFFMIEGIDNVIQSGSFTVAGLITNGWTTSKVVGLVTTGVTTQIFIIPHIEKAVYSLVEYIHNSTPNPVVMPMEGSKDVDIEAQISTNFEMEFCGSSTVHMPKDHCDAEINFEMELLDNSFSNMFAYLLTL